MKNVDELTGGESCVCVLCFYEDIFSGSVLIFRFRFVHSRIFDITHNGDRNVVTLKRTVDTSWIPEQQAFILTKESSVSNFKMSEALGTLEEISSIIFSLFCFRQLTSHFRKIGHYFGYQIFGFIAKVVDRIFHKLQYKSSRILVLWIEFKNPWQMFACPSSI